MAAAEPSEGERSQPELRLDLLAKVAHDVRTPLASLQGYLELLLLRHGELDPVEARNYLHTAVRQSERLSHLVSNLFEWGRLEAGETRANPEDFMLAELLHDVKQRFDAQAQRREVSLQVAGVQPVQAQAVVRADIALVERALGALLDNALRHTPAGGSVTLAHEVRADEVHVEVRDTGSGIDPQALADIFTHYERSARTTRAEAGAGDGQGGLGLAIARRIAQLHGSELHIHSQLQQGTHVSFGLPLAAATRRGGRTPAAHGAPLEPAPDSPVTAQLQELRSRLARSDAERAAERAAAQAAQRALEQRYGLAVRGAQDGLWEWDVVSGAVLLSPRWNSMLGLDDGVTGSDKSAWLSHVHPDDRNAYARALQLHLADPDARFEQTVRMLHRDGSLRHVLSRGVALRDDDGTPYRMVGLDSDVTPVRRVQTVLDAVAEGTAGAHGADFFAATVRHFARALDLDCAFITECIDHPPTRLRTLAFWSRDGGLRENFEYALRDTPCDAVVNQARDCFIAHGLASRFPAEKGFETYLGLPIIASDGRVIGHLAFLNAEPRGEEILVDSVYRIFLARTAAEIERLRALAQLQALQQSMGASRSLG